MLLYNIYRHKTSKPVKQVAPQASIGVAVADNPSTPLNTLIKQAEAALYQAKAAGRNQVVIAR